MALIFVTGNESKLSEARDMLCDVENKKIDLPEIQGDLEEVCKAKVEAAYAQIGKPCFVDDTALSFEALKGLPGVYIKAFLEKLGREGLLKLLAGHQNKTAYAQCAIGYHDGIKAHVFVGKVKGTMVPPRGDKFGWDPLFVPDGFGRTYAEMSPEEKHAISHRGKALRLMKEFLDRKK